MNTNNYQKVAHIAIWFGSKLLLAEIVKEGHHKGYWTDTGGKVEKNEDILDAAIREVKEEIGLSLIPAQLRLVDCFIYDKREIKSFLFEVKLDEFRFGYVINKEPNKHKNWRLYSVTEALKLQLLPSIRQYLLSHTKHI